MQSILSSEPADGSDGMSPGAAQISEDLLRKAEEQQTRIQDPERRVQRSGEENGELGRKTRKDSTNPGNPPSSDLSHRKTPGYPGNEKAEKTPGPYHTGAVDTLLPADEITSHTPECCPHCGGSCTKEKQGYVHRIAQYRSIGS